MNSKKNSGWILCPSKSFPGQFYYFNVVNGETAWSLNDAEKKFLRKDESIQKVDKSHCYPEPSHPPDDTPFKPIGQTKPVFGQTEPLFGQRKPVFSETKPLFGQKDLRNGHNKIDNRFGQSVSMQHQIPTFGQVVFPKLLPMTIPQISNIIWTPMQIQVPTAFITSQTNQENYENPTHKSPDIDLLVETCNRPLCERFINYEKPIINFSKENKVLNKTHATSSPIQSEINFSLSKMKINDQRYDAKVSTNKHLDVSAPKPLIREEILKTPDKLGKNYFHKTPSNSYDFTKSEISPKTNVFKQSKKCLFQNSVTKYEDISQKNLFEMKSADDSQNYKQKYLFQTTINENSALTQGNTEQNRFQAKMKRKYLNQNFDANLTLRRGNKVDIQPNQFLSPQENSINRVLQTEAKNSTLCKGRKVGIDPNQCPTPQGNSKPNHTKGVLQTSDADNEDRIKSNQFKMLCGEKSTLSQGDEGSELTLEKNDLRNVLLARRRKTAVVQDPIVTDNKTKSKQPLSKPAAAKKVTFKLNHEKDPEALSDITSDDDFSRFGGENPISIEEDNHALQELKKLAPPSVRNECWYIAVDTDVLLEDLKFLDSFVQLDLKCRLLVPSRVMSDIVALSRGECRERRRVTLARHSVRLLATPQPHIIVENTLLDDNTGMSVSDSILKCCLDAKERNHVVLITNDQNLQSIAKSLNIHAFTAREIKDGAAQKTKIQFDIIKLKISIPNEQENEKKFAEIKDAPSNPPQKKIFDGIRCNNAFINGNHSMKTQTDVNNTTENESGTNESTDIGKLYNLTLKEQPDLFPIQREVLANPTQIPNTLQKDQNVQKSNETVSFYFQNKNDKIEKEIDQNNHDPDLDETQQTVSFHFQKHTTNDSQNHSIFEINNNKGNNGENRNICSINQPKNSIFDFANEKSKNKDPKYSFGNVSLKTKGTKNPYIFERDDKFNLINENRMTIDDRINDKADEWICSFRQIMEECLSAVLQKSLSSIQRRMPPPWSLFEALQCIKNLYGDHDTVKNMVEAICEKLFDMNSKTDTIKSRISPKDFVGSIECGLLLVQTLKDIAPAESLIDAESSLNIVLRDIEHPAADSEECLKTPANYKRDVVKQQENMINFVKDRSEVVNYLKRHFAAWQSYGDSWEHKKSPRMLGQNRKDMTIVRTFGKNLSQLKINNSRTMTMIEADEDSDVIRQQININHTNNPVGDDKMTLVRKVNDKTTDFNDQNQVTFDETRKTVGSVSETLNGDPKSDKPYHTGLKLLREEKNNMSKDLQGGILAQNDAKSRIDKENITVPKVIRVFEKFQVTKDVQEKTYIDAENGCLVPKMDPEKTEPKVIRLFNKIKVLKNCTIDKPNFDLNFTTHENTFGQTEEHAGPKVVRNIKILPAFENKLKIKEPSDLDELDYSVMSGSENDYFCKAALNENDGENIISRNHDFKMNQRQNNIDKHTENCDIYQDDQCNVRYALDNAINVINDGANTIRNNSSAVDKDNYVKDYESYAKENESHASNQSKEQRTINTNYSKDMRVHATNDFNANTSERHYNENGNNAKESDSTYDKDIYNSNNASVSTNNYSMDNENSSTNNNSRYHNAAYNNSYETNNNNYATNNDNYAKSVREPLNRDDTTNDSGFENESVHAYSLVKSFLSELSCSIKLVHKFIDESIKEIRGNKLEDNKKRLLHNKAHKTHEKITAIIDRLKSIIEREAIEGSSLKVLLATAGTEACGDKRMTKYRQVVTKCLEQAQMLESALEMMLSVTDNGIAIVTNPGYNPVRHFNIFE